MHDLRSPLSHDDHVGKGDDRDSAISCIGTKKCSSSVTRAHLDRKKSISNNQEVSNDESPAKNKCHNLYAVKNRFVIEDNFVNCSSDSDVSWYDSDLSLD